MDERLMLVISSTCRRLSSLLLIYHHLFVCSDACQGTLVFR